MGAVFGGIASLLGVGSSLLSSSQQAAAAQAAANNLTPFRNAGLRGAQTLENMLGLRTGPIAGGANPTFQGSPGYQWQLGQGIDAIQNSAASRGGVVSGNTLKALDSYGQGLANQDWYNYLGQLSGLSSLGENAASGSGNFMTQAGNARAAGTVGAGNSLTNLLPFLANSFQNNPGNSIAGGFDFTNNPGLYPPAATNTEF